MPRRAYELDTPGAVLTIAPADIWALYDEAFPQRRRWP